VNYGQESVAVSVSDAGKMRQLSGWTDVSLDRWASCVTPDLPTASERLDLGMLFPKSASSATAVCESGAGRGRLRSAPKW
jgi:hypothetical protein